MFRDGPPQDRDFLTRLILVICKKPPVGENLLAPLAALNVGNPAELGVTLRSRNAFIGPPRLQIREILGINPAPLNYPEARHR